MRRVDIQMERQLKMLAEATPRRRQGYKYGSLYGAQLAEGIRFSNEPYTEAEQEALLEIFSSPNRPLWQIKHCYFNAQSLALDERRLSYAEGYVMTPDLALPIEHGWAALGDKPVDITLRKYGQPDTCDPEELLARASKNLKNAYVGVIVDKKEVSEAWFHGGRAEQMLYVPEILDAVLRYGFMDFPGTR